LIITPAIQIDIKTSDVHNPFNPYPIEFPRTTQILYRLY
jgi:hypothetical protein